MGQLKILKAKDQTACIECSARRYAWFKPCNQETLTLHQNYRTSQPQLAAGDYLFMEGDESHAVYTLQEGWVICFKSLANGQRQILHVGLAGDFLGYRVNFDEPIDYSIMAVTQCTICAFSEKAIRTLLQADAQLINRLLEIHSETSKECRTNLAYVGQSTAKLKVAFFLNKMLRRLEERGADITQSVYFPLTREEIADAIGITSVHLCRISVELRRSEIVDCRHNRLEVLNCKKLEALAASVF
jgi:CRP-like cAMP-binding protein